VKGRITMYQRYEKPEMEIMLLEEEDMICTSSIIDDGTIKDDNPGDLPIIIPR